MSECPPRDRKIVFIPSESDEKTSIFNDFQRHEVQPIYRNILDPICLHSKVISYWVDPLPHIANIRYYRDISISIMDLTATRPSRRSRLASAPAQTGANLPVLKATHHHPSSTARSNRTRLLRVPHAPRGSRERGNSELPPRTLRSLRREPQSSTALRILFSQTLRA